MAKADRTTLKSYFETGDRPTQAQFIDLIDSSIDIMIAGQTPLQATASLAAGTGISLAQSGSTITVTSTVTSFAIAASEQADLSSTASIQAGDGVELSQTGSVIKFTGLSIAASGAASLTKSACFKAGDGIALAQTGSIIKFTGLSIAASLSTSLTQTACFQAPTACGLTISQSGSVITHGVGNDYRIKAWINFDGQLGTPTARASFNVDSITDNGTGQYTINFITPFANANYVAVGTCASPEGGAIVVASVALPTTTAYRFETRTVGAGAPVDKAWINMIFIGDQ